MEKQHADGENRAKLNHDEEHVPKRLGNVHLDELVNQDHVPGGRDGQPFGDALDESHKR